MPALYRVFPYLTSAASTEPGGAFYIPGQGGGRADNPELYSVLYFSDAAAGAIAEAFGRFPEWTGAMLAGSQTAPGSRRAIARFDLLDKEPVCNLDDARQLLTLKLRPTDVVTRDYNRSRAWARRIYSMQRWSGVRWWSYYDPKWASFAIWDLRSVALQDVSVIELDDPALLEASRTIARSIIPSRRG